ncbi:MULTISPECIES: hypothetical protein [Streptomyces]|uniref:Hydrogenase expression protein HypF n=1 Tax=Streptomyces griseus subsp. griseus (strain JCM 4626 / CBS 651.72 / NBRC 13350 / KCC S-0626 / ISP 5235) TaxID=455632 RepID=B1W054_STRGG|nr:MULTISPECIES: hypothetical protein [Streptomyces]MYR49766.1 hypothetical protein [Streptomyces sp. SID4928]EGE41710.1 hypothetical protein SACT1_2363 [Streptomyces sp. ACT-1]MBW3704595.1 hypothetical protein [Streptomyces griseus]SED35387.1 hypothetical protein SAMN04490359_0135 [Streptomyces griseus]SQA26348.1 Uncharacterised protein [Streptomyces griseus]
MRGDDGQLTNAHPGDDLRERKGPRHAAPRKSLLTKLHLPSGKKALALAAMPTAVFVGMGLTPKLALADDRADIPFAPGPCVTRSDEPSASESPEATPSPSATAKDEKDDASGKGDEAAPKPSAGGSAPGPDEDPAPEADKSARSAGEAPAASPSATPTPTRSKNPLDPLGVGDALRDLFDGPDDEAGTQEPASPSPSPTTGTPKPSDEPKDPAGDAADRAKETSDKTADAIREAAGKAGKDVEELDEDVKGLDPKKDEDIPDGAKPRFPCPEPDPDALAAAELEPGIPLLPSDPWILESTRLTLNGLDYHGIVEVRKADGSIKKVLKFTASSIDIKDLHQLTVGPAGTTGHVKSRPGSTSEIRDGEVTMYTEELKGNLFGLIPVTFSPETPPPLNVPFAVFTAVKVVQAGQFGGTLTVPGLKNYLDGA